MVVLKTTAFFFSFLLILRRMGEKKAPTLSLVVACFHPTNYLLLFPPYFLHLSIVLL